MGKYRWGSGGRADRTMFDRRQFYLEEPRAVRATQMRVEGVEWVWLRRGRYLRVWE